MPPKKKSVKAAKAPVKKAKRPVGRPRKPLGTRVSDVDLLANVGSTKPMPRRIGRDALEQQRARIRYAVDYPGRRFTERMTRALQDSFATGALPYGVSLRAPADFKRPYTTTFEPIAGMPVWPAINVPPNAAAEDSLRLLEAAAAAASAAPDPAIRPTKRARRSGAPGTSGPLNRPLPGDTSEVYVPDTKVVDRQKANEQNAIKVAAAAARVRDEELANLRRRLGNARRRSQGLPAILSPDENLATSFLRANTDEPSKSFSAPATGAPDSDFVRQRLEAILSRVPTPTAQRDDQPTRSRAMPSSRAAQLGALSTAEQSQVASALANERARKRPKGLTEDQKRSAKYLSALLSSVRAPPPTPIPPTISVPTLVVPPPPTAADRDLEREYRYALIDRLREIDDQLLRTRAGRSNSGLKRERESILEELQKEAALASAALALPQQMVVSVPDPVAVNAELQDLTSRATELEEELLRTRSGTSQASTRRELENVHGAIEEVRREVAAATPSSAPVQPRVVLSDDSRDELEQLQELIATYNSVLSRPMSSSQSAAYDDLREDLERSIRRMRELMRASTISEPATAPQSIVVPGTETPVPTDALQRMMEVQGRLVDSIDHLRRLSSAPSPAMLDLRYDPGTGQYYSRDIPYETQRGRQALESRTASEAQDIDREQAELRVPRSRMERLTAAIASKITPDVIKEEKTKFARMAEEAAMGNRLIAQSEAARLKKSKGPPVNDLRAAAKRAFMPPATARRLNQEADIRVNKAPAIRQELAEPAPGRATGISDLVTGISDLDLETSDLQRIARNPDSLPGTIALLNEELARREDENRAVRAVLEPGPADTAQIPPPSNPPEPSSQDGPATGSVNGTGLQHVTAATFPSSKWTTASSLRWLRSNGLHPIRKSTKINGAYSYALQSPAGYSSFNSVKMSHKNKDFTIVYGTPK